MVYTERIRDNFTFAHADHMYKRDRLVVELSCELKRETMTGISLLSYLLGSGTDRFRDIVSLSRYLDRLYGGSLYVSSSRTGNRMRFHFDVDNVSGHYLHEPDLGLEAAALLCDVMTDPYLPGGSFPEKTVEIEKEKLREEIQFLINNKEAYCTRMLLKHFFRSSSRSLPVLGFEEDIPSLSGSGLTELYRDCLRRCNINVFYCGEDLERVRDTVVRTVAENGIGSVPLSFDEDLAEIPSEPFEYSESVGTEQDISSMVFHSGRKPDSRALAVLKVSNAILGGMPTSRLFMNVREKQSLCYSCVSSRMTAGGAGILIESSTSPEKYSRTRDAVIGEYLRLGEEGPSPDELREAKLSISNSIKSIFDTPAGAASHYLGSVNSIGYYIPPEEELELLESVREQDVRDCLTGMAYCGSYRLTDER